MTEIISSPNIPTMKSVHADERRAIHEVQVEDTEGARRVTLLEIGENGGTLGNHFHLNSDEEFRLFQGEARVITADPTEPEESREEVHLVAPAEIIIPKGTAHTFVFDGEAQLVSTMAGEYDPNDMHPYELV